jgi:hypothetical protein
MPSARAGGGGAVALLVMLFLAASCASGPPAGAAGHAARQGAPPGTSGAGSSMKMLASAYLAIAGPANHRLETEVNGFSHHERSDLALAEADLRAEAATEQAFDRLLAKIPFPPRIAVTAHALVLANQSPGPHWLARMLWMPASCAAVVSWPLGGPWSWRSRFLARSPGGCAVRWRWDAG